LLGYPSAVKDVELLVLRHTQWELGSARQANLSK